MKTKKNQLHRIFAVLMASVLLISCFSLTTFADSKTPTMKAQQGETEASVTITTKRANRTFELYQIFYGDYEAAAGKTTKTLTDIQWGVSIVKTGSYDLSTALITALKKEIMPDGETANPLATSMAALGDKTDAASVASQLTSAIPSDASDTAQASYADAFARIIGYVIAQSKETVDKETCDELTDSGYVFSGLHDGYYMVSDVTDITDEYIEPSEMTTQMLSSYIVRVAGTVSIDMKLPAAPSVDKKIVTENGDQRFDDVAVGDEVTFKITGTVPDMSEFNKYYYQLNDTMSKGLTFKEITSITVGDVTLTETEDPEDTGTTYYKTATTVTDAAITTDGTYLTITFSNMKQYKQGQSITVLYTATVNEKAIIGKSDDSEGGSNWNKVYVSYSNDPKHIYEGENQPTSEEEKYFGSTGETKVYLYTTGIKIAKVDGETKALAGAKFKIEGNAQKKIVEVKDVFTATGYYAGEAITDAWYKLTDGTYTQQEPTTSQEYTAVAEAATEAVPVREFVKYKYEDGKYTADLNGTYYKVIDGDCVPVADTTPEQGTHETAVVYYLKESVTTVTTEDEAVDITREVGVDGILDLNGLKAGEYTITEVEAPVGYNALLTPITIKIEWTEPATGKISEGCTWKFAVDMEGGDNYKEMTATTEGIYKLTVVNQAGSTLPHTGGIGTTIFYVIGSILVLGAAILLIAKKRMSREN